MGRARWAFLSMTTLRATAARATARWAGEPTVAARVRDVERTTTARRLDVLANRDLRRFLGGYAATMLGTTMTPVALTFAVLDRGGDAGDVGLVLTAESVPLTTFRI